MTYKFTTLKTHLSRKRLFAFVAIFGLMSQFVSPILQPTHAAGLTDSYIRLERMKTNTTDVDTMVVFSVPAGNSATEDRVRVTFPSNTYITVAAPTVTVTGCPGSSTALPGTLSASESGQSITVTGVTNLTASTSYCFIITSGVSTAGTAIPNSPLDAGSTTIDTMSDGSTVVDTTNVALKTYEDDTVVVTASVAPYLQFSLSANSDDLANLDPAAIVSSSSPSVVNIKTNASKGWIGWVKSENSGLTSASASKTINNIGTVDGSPSTLTIGQEAFGLDARVFTDSGTAGTGTVTIDPEYNGGVGNDQVGTLNGSYNRFAYASGPTDNDFVTLTLRSTISALTPAASDYTDTLTVIGAGNF